MKKWILLLTIAVFVNVFAQEEKYEVAVIGFYNLENLFDTDSSMHTINVDKLNAGDPNYVLAEDYDADKYYDAKWNNTFENLRISKSKVDYSQLPELPVHALEYSKPKKKDYEERNETTISKSEFKALVTEDDRWFSKKEFKNLKKTEETVTINTNEVVAKVRDAENTPNGQRLYTQELYEDKLAKLAEVIDQLGADYSKDGAALIGLAEIENSKVLEDLVQTGAIKKKGYQVLQYDCMYSRGVDVALLYQEKYFEVINTHTLQIAIYNDKKETSRYYTRDILWVEGKFLGETVHVFVNHWPSRRGGEAKSSKNRELGAQACKTVIDSLMALDPSTQIILMGDFNDDPNNKSIKKVLEASAKNAEDVEEGGLFNPLFKDYKKGYGSLAYRGSWNLFDQILVSSSFVDDKSSTWKLQDAEVVYNQDWINRFGGYEGGPNRSFGGNNYQGGYSDHLPSVVYLKRVAKEDKDNDGIADEDDDCPEIAGIAAFNGCPDTDEDGIMDKEDLCPETKGLTEFKGCPDSDGDGVEDSKDNCPNEKGAQNNNGCPNVDTDGDGVFDKDDKCPETKGLKDNNGCPQLNEDITSSNTTIPNDFKNIFFNTNNSTIQKSSDADLIEVAEIMKTESTIKLRINGHTDNDGEETANMDLSKNRAYAVKDRLVKLGVDAARMEVFYFGETRPVAPNNTTEGKQANRRVELEINAK